MDRAKLHTALDLILDAFEGQSAAPADALVRIERKALEAEGIEHKPIVTFAESGELRTVWIGRKRYTKRSWLLALADVLPAATKPVADDDIARAAAKRAARRVA